MKGLIDLLKLWRDIIIKAIVFEYEAVEEVAVRDGVDILLGRLEQ
jgi:hypothetical protein